MTCSGHGHDLLAVSGMWGYGDQVCAAPPVLGSKDLSCMKIGWIEEVSKEAQVKPSKIISEITQPKVKLVEILQVTSAEASPNYSPDNFIK